MMEKVAIKYSYRITMDDISDFLLNFGYDPGTVFITSDNFEYPNRVYADDIGYNVPMNFHGIGIYTSIGEEFPKIIIETCDNQIHIFDPKIVEMLKECYPNKKLVFISITFERAFEKHTTLKEVLDEARKDELNASNTRFL